MGMKKLLKFLEEVIRIFHYVQDLPRTRRGKLMEDTFTKWFRG